MPTSLDPRIRARKKQIPNHSTPAADAPLSEATPTMAGGAKITNLTLCLQSDVSARWGDADLARQLSVSSRERPPPTPGNDANGTPILSLVRRAVRSRQLCE